MTDEQRARFDELLEEALEELPPELLLHLEEVPLIVDDRPDEALIVSLLTEAGEPVSPASIEAMATELCGLHSGVSLIEQGVSDATMGLRGIRLFREGIVAHAGGWGGELFDEPVRDEHGAAVPSDELIYGEILITLLHELGHHFGLDEDDLERLGYA